MAKPTADQLAFLESHDIDPPRSIWNCKPTERLCQRLIAYFEEGNGATDKGDAETLTDRAELYEAAQLEFMHLIAMPKRPRPTTLLRDDTNGPVEVLRIEPKSPRWVARQQKEARESDLAISPFHVTIVPANTLIKEGNVHGGDLGDYRVAPQGTRTEGHWVDRFPQGRVYISGRPVEPINFFRALELEAGLL